MKLLFATTNRGKLRELEALIEPLAIEVVSPATLGFSLPLVDEDAPTFAGNAAKKARSARAASGLTVVADDSGLEVDALDGAPGVHTARYAAADLPADAPAGDIEAANLRKLLDALGGLPVEKRGARFRCVLALAPVGRDDVALFEGTCPGHITEEPRGTGGFGYDPLFVPAGETETLAEMALAKKNTLSHRARAMAALAAHLNDPKRPASSWLL